MSVLRKSSYSSSASGMVGGDDDMMMMGGGNDDVNLLQQPDIDSDDNQQHAGSDEDDDDNENDNELAELAAAEKEDPLLLAIDDLEGRVVAALDDVKLHPGYKTNDDYTNVHEELATLLRPVVEVAAHTAPSIARTYHHGVGEIGVEQSVGDVYERIVSDLVLPVLLEMAQSETVPAKRCASLEFFRQLWRETHKAGSWLDSTCPPTSPLLGPYGSGDASSSSSSSHHAGKSVSAAASASSSSSTSAEMRATVQRRQAKRLAREGEILRYWVQASIACTVPGTFSDDASASVVASRGILAAAASIRPSLHHVSKRIRDADDRGASRLYAPVMKMIEGVLKQLFLSQPSGGGGEGAVRSNEPLISGSVKFLEIVVMCCSHKPKDQLHHQQSSSSSGGGRHGGGSGRHHSRGGGPGVVGGGREVEDFSLEDLPVGHPVITREALESIAEYAFTTLRGLTLMGGQVKMDVNLLSDLMLSGGGVGTTPSAQVVSILKPAALAFLEMEDSLPKLNSDRDPLDYHLDRASCDYDFILPGQKSYSLCINSLAALALNRPMFFQESALTLARRAVQPPVVSEVLSQPAILALTVQLKASCLTMLRNALSVATKSFNVLHTALKRCDMEVQADKALKMAQQTTALKTAGRAARNRANLYYEWEGAGAGASDSARTGQMRLRETDDALAQMRAAKAARGLGHGIQLPANMTDAVELVVVNLQHLPAQRPKSSSTSASASGNKRNSKTPKFTLDFVVDAIMTNGASLWQEEGLWYDRDGGSAWSLRYQENGEPEFTLSSKLQEVLDQAELAAGNESSGPSKSEESETAKRRKLFRDQCNSAAADAFSRIVNQASYSRSKSLANFGNQIAARLAFTMRKIAPSKSLEGSYNLAKESAKDAFEILYKDESNDEELRKIAGRSARADDVERLLVEARESLERFVDAYPHVSLGLALDATTEANPNDLTDVSCSISSRLLNEALLQGCADKSSDNEFEWYDASLDLWIASTVRAGKLANEKPNDNARKRIAARSAANLQRELTSLPRLTRSSLLLISAMCDIEGITKKAAEASHKESQDSIAASAAAHAAKVAAEKRATAALLVLRDACFQREDIDTRKCAVECAVAVASGRLPSTASIQDKALKLTMNVLYAKNDTIAEYVVQAATSELEYFTQKAVDAFDSLRRASAASEKDDHQRSNPLAPRCEEEKEMMNRLKKPAVMYMALGVRRPDIIETLFRLASREKADVLSKTVRVNMSKLARAAAAKHGAAEIAIRVAAMSSAKETPMLLSFLENLAPGSDRSDTEAEIVEACFKIQELKKDENGKKDPRYIIPVVSVMRRCDLVRRLPEFVAADSKIFLAALERMGHRLQRQALLFRDEPDEDNPSLHGMTLCEQLVYLHKLDFAASGLPQKSYLAAIKICLEDDEVYNDRVVMSALDHMSGTFLADATPLPLAFMRTVILTCTKHESLHSWICHVLLPRLVEGKIYEDARQWEGWMRCAHMLEKSGDSGVNSMEAISKLPPEQMMMYRTKWMH